MLHDALRLAALLATHPRFEARPRPPTAAHNLPLPPTAFRNLPQAVSGDEWLWERLIDESAKWLDAEPHASSTSHPRRIHTASTPHPRRIHTAER